MPSPQFKLYIAASVDGYIATPDGGVSWLDPYNSSEMGYEEFISAIGTVVIGRKTFEQVLSFGVPWPYDDQRTVVLTSRPVDNLPPRTETYAGDLQGLAAELRRAGGKDVWIVGGAKVVRQMLDQNLIDAIELFVIPVLLGDGIPLFDRSKGTAPLKLETAHPFTSGVVRLAYRLGDARGKVGDSPGSRLQ